MKKLFTMFTVFMIFLFAICFLTACEKETHDGIDYFKSKCTAELNGLQLINQTPFHSPFSPDSPQATPYFLHDEDGAFFMSDLASTGKACYLYGKDKPLCRYAGSLSARGTDNRKNRD